MFIGEGYTGVQRGGTGLLWDVARAQGEDMRSVGTVGMCHILAARDDISCCHWVPGQAVEMPGC